MNSKQTYIVSASRGKPVDPVYASGQDKKYENKTPNAQAGTVIRFLLSQALASPYIPRAKKVIPPSSQPHDLSPIAIKMQAPDIVNSDAIKAYGLK